MERRILLVAVLWLLALCGVARAVSFPIVADTDDVMVSSVASTAGGWPPTGGVSCADSFDVFGAKVNQTEAALDSGNYYRRILLLRWDTSSLGAGTTTAATLQCKANRLFTVDSGFGFSCGYVSDWSPCDAGDYITTVETDAVARTMLDTIVLGTNDFTMTNVSSINRSGVTALRCFVSNAGNTAPSLVNIAEWFDEADTDEPPCTLIVTDDPATPTSTPTSTPTNTLQPGDPTYTPSETPTVTPTPVNTSSPTRTPTQTPTRTRTITPTPSTTGSPTWTPTITQTFTPTIVGADPRRAGWTWWHTTFAGEQPLRSWANGGTFGVYAPSAGRLQDLTVLAKSPSTGAVTMSVNGSTINAVSCSYAAQRGCKNWNFQTGDFATFNAGDYINMQIDGGVVAGDFFATMTILAQDETEHDASIIWGSGGGQVQGQLCIPIGQDLGGSSCQGVSTVDAFSLPTSGDVTNYSRNGNALRSGPPPNLYTLKDITTSTSVFTVSQPNGTSAVFGSCTSGCGATGGDRYAIELTTYDGLVDLAITHVLEFSGMGQVITNRSPMWFSGSEARYGNQGARFSAVISDSLACAERAGVAKNFRVRASQAVNLETQLVFCSGTEPSTINCVSGPRPHCTIPSGSTTCEDLTSEVVVPRGYVYTVLSTSPGNSAGTLGWSFEMAPPATPVEEVSGCGFATPIATNTRTPTSVPMSPTPTNTLVPGAPTPTPTPTPTTTPTPVPGCCHCPQEVSCTPIDGGCPDLCTLVPDGVCLVIP